MGGGGRGGGGGGGGAGGGGGGTSVSVQTALFPNKRPADLLPRFLVSGRYSRFKACFQKDLFVEIRFFDDDAQDPWVEIVNAHPQV